MTRHVPPAKVLIDTMRQIRDGRVEAAYNEPPARDPWIRELHEAGLIFMVFTRAELKADDYWDLTAAGCEWLTEHDTEGDC